VVTLLHPQGAFQALARVRQRTLLRPPTTFKRKRKATSTISNDSAEQYHEPSGV
jgi:hypothetical protein